MENDKQEFLGALCCMELIDVYDDLGQKCGKTEENLKLIEKD
jgi:hypothetical protein